MSTTAPGGTVTVTSPATMPETEMTNVVLPEPLASTATTVPDDVVTLAAVRVLTASEKVAVTISGDVDTGMPAMALVWPDRDTDGGGFAPSTDTALS